MPGTMDSTGLAVGLKKGFIVEKRKLAPKPASRKGVSAPPCCPCPRGSIREGACLPPPPAAAPCVAPRGCGVAAAKLQPMHGRCLVDAPFCRVCRGAWPLRDRADGSVDRELRRSAERCRWRAVDGHTWARARSASAGAHRLNDRWRSWGRFRHVPGPSPAERELVRRPRGAARQLGAR